MRFHDRHDAGEHLAAQVTALDLEDPVVLALPRGGVPVAAQLARALHAPLDVFVARKVGAPGHAEFGIGAIAEGGVVVADPRILRAVGVDRDEFARLAEQEAHELARRVERYRHGRPLGDLRGRDVIVVDDGLATGVTAEAALRSLHRHEPRRLVLAVPVCAPDTAERLRLLADAVVCVASPADFGAVGAWYEIFDQTSDEEVDELLHELSEVTR